MFREPLKSRDAWVLLADGRRVKRFVFNVYKVPETGKIFGSTIVSPLESWLDPDSEDGVVFRTGTLKVIQVERQNFAWSEYVTNHKPKRK